jgi:hypothetical protein
MRGIRGYDRILQAYFQKPVDKSIKNVPPIKFCPFVLDRLRNFDKNLSYPIQAPPLGFSTVWIYECTLCYIFLPFRLKKKFGIF